ncbi:hypothetical protein [Piscirickettsia litoralis]|uniref:hypothetical protein n=1 Tax=Piscirickettsia litoralis TaxID=1891921 RepID=UPI000B14AB8B|nr:hypothetical protein [Piscirickettsia litoralis]
MFSNVDPSKYNDEFLAVQDVVASYADLYKDYVKSEEIYGKKYELMSGDSTSIHKGNSTHKSQGNSSHTHTGDSHHTHNGDSHSSHSGNKSGSHHINSDTKTELCGLVAHAGATGSHLATKNDLAHAEHHASITQVKAIMTPLKADMDLIGAHGKVSTGIKSSSHTGLDSAAYSGLYERVYTMAYQTTRNHSSDVVAFKDDIILSKRELIPTATFTAISEQDQAEHREYLGLIMEQVATTDRRIMAAASMASSPLQIFQ